MFENFFNAADLSSMPAEAVPVFMNVMTGYLVSGDSQVGNRFADPQLAR